MTQAELQLVANYLKSTVRILEMNRGSLTVLQLRILGVIKPVLSDLLMFEHDSLSRAKPPVIDGFPHDSRRDNSSNRLVGE